MRSNFFVNGFRANIRIGDTVKIYYTTNSCCYYCYKTTNDAILNYVGTKNVLSDTEDCAGCNYTDALVFVAKQKGIDTVKGKILPASMSCLDSITNFEKHIIYVD